MKFIVEIDCDNAAFMNDDSAPVNGQELARILRDIADKAENGQNVDGITLRDINGNSVGMSQFSDLQD